MNTRFIFRTWPHDKTERLKELWWQGKTPAQCCALLNATSPRAVVEKAQREGFVRDPRIIPADAATLLPVSRETGELVTMRNCTANECRWGYGPPAANMPMCGRPVARRGIAWCEAHQRAAYKASNTVAR